MKQKTWIIIGLVLGVALLAGAAFAIPGLASGRLQNLVGGLPGFSENSKPGDTDVKLIPAPELPQRPPDWVGTVANTSNNSIFATPRNGGTPIEIVTTHDTHIWEDDNGEISKNVRISQSDSEGTVHVQEIVQAIPISQVIASDDILIWGEQRGDRWIASTVLLRGMVGAKGGTPVPVK